MDDGTKIAVWLNCSNKSHDIAFARYPEPGKLHHVSYCWEKVLRADDICSMNNVKLAQSFKAGTAPVSQSQY